MTDSYLAVHDHAYQPGHLDAGLGHDTFVCCPRVEQIRGRR
ncbi:hypothetical protein [Nonomuraea turcica]|nr:hypothetical protein [Nonomuraea sp. G32]MDP4507917.1 hypothetical protein [Nonomuraea sp. G32]